MTNTQDSVTIYVFGEITITAKDSIGVCILSESTKSKIKSLSVDAARVANKSAWKQLKSSNKLAERHCNASIAGNSDIHDMYAKYAHIAEQVTKCTYKNFMGFN